MAAILLFHHVHGVTPGVTALAEGLRGAGHTVHVPDLFDGRRFDSLETGAAHAAEIGFGEIVARGRRSAEGLPDGLVYVGLSLGVLPAQALAQTRPGAAGALLISGCVPPTEFGDGWPDGVPVQVHGMDADEFFAGEGDLEAARALVASTADAELFLYPGADHLFCDSSLPTYDREATELLTERATRLLDRVG
ncbi:UNVERIFIED_ORG: dienelactone hydrolase [Bacillus sp. AZ43]